MLIQYSEARGTSSEKLAAYVEYVSDGMAMAPAAAAARYTAKGFRSAADADKYVAAGSEVCPSFSMLADCGCRQLLSATALHVGLRPMPALGVVLNSFEHFDGTSVDTSVQERRLRVHVWDWAWQDDVFWEGVCST